MPAYEPDEWNDGDEIQEDNNCYNYACNQKTGTFAQPGEGHGVDLHRPLSCDDVSRAAELDGLEPSTRNNECDPGCWKVALVVDPDPNDGDFHWYRQDNTGQWSHKPGNTEARDTDDDGFPITNPETAAMGSYRFCGYFCCCPNLVEISSTTIEEGSIGRPSETAALTSSLKEPLLAVTLKSPAKLLIHDAEISVPAGRLEVHAAKDKIVGRRDISVPESVLVTARIYAGRRNPTWLLTQEQGDDLTGRLTDLQPCPLPGPPPLGYQGYSFRNPGVEKLGRILAVYDGRITTNINGSRCAFRDDHGIELFLTELAKWQPFGSEVVRAIEKSERLANLR